MKRTLILALMILAAVSSAPAQGTTAYPGSLDSGATLPTAVDNKITFLTAAITDGATVLAVNSTAGLPSTVIAQIDAEMLFCSVTNATTLTCSRGVSNSSAAAHAIRAAVRFPLAAPDINGVRGAVIEVEKKVGIGICEAAAAATGTVLTKKADGTTCYETHPVGTVTSVGITAVTPLPIVVTGSPITTSGNISLSLVTQAANTIFAGPATGASAAPAFRSLVEADIPTLDASKLSGTIAAARMPALTGDVTTSAGAVATTLASVGSPGTYTKVTTDAKGRVTSGSALSSGDLPSHAHAAADVTSGTLDTARLGSGTASASTFLRGDQTWAAPPVVSVFGRTGAVVAAANDYTWAQINKATSSLADITTRSASDLSSGTLPDGRFPATLPAASGANLTALNASNLSSGTVAVARLPTLPYARATATAHQSIPNAAYTDIALGAESHDTDSIHDNTTNNARLTCTTAGLYQLTANAHFDPSAAGQRIAAIVHNGSTFVARQVLAPITTAGGGTQFVLSATYACAAGEYFTFRVYQDSGAALNARNDFGGSVFSMFLIR